MLEELDLLAVGCVLDVTSASFDVDIVIAADHCSYRQYWSTNAHVIKLNGHLLVVHFAIDLDCAQLLSRYHHRPSHTPWVSPWGCSRGWCDLEVRHQRQWSVRNCLSRPSIRSHP